MIVKKILTVAGPEWQSALAGAVNFSTAAGPVIEPRDAADAVVLLATQPATFSALALEAAAGGPWLDTLLDLTLGDTGPAVPLVMLGQAEPGETRLEGTATLEHPVSQTSLHQALDWAARTSRHFISRPPEALPNIESIRMRYQPIVRLADMRPGSVEILARAVAADGQIIGPETIINAMTTSDRAMTLTGLIVQIALAERAEGHFDDLGVAFAFNLPLDAMLHPELVPIVERVRQNAGIRAEIVRFELTETQPVTDLATTFDVITRLRDAGYRLALDDITPKTPNLDQLLELPFRAVKLDIGVVTGAMHKDPDIAGPAQDFIRRVTTQAAKTGRAVVAEGIESAATLEAMRNLGVTHGQGYHFARPLPARALQPWLTHWAGGAVRA
jgi:EAL domain-containing protein (putative c-di-GMP-specific phosphodiesterase class I)